MSLLGHSAGFLIISVASPFFLTGVRWLRPDWSVIASILPADQSCGILFIIDFIHSFSLYINGGPSDPMAASHGAMSKTNENDTKKEILIYTIK